jgi:zinc carboxypeptidase
MPPPLPYRTVEEIDAEITALANDFPSTCHRVDLTHQTHEGRTMAYLKIGTGEGTNRPKVLITTGVHGRELLPPDAILNYLRKLLTAYRDQRSISVASFTDTVNNVTYPSTELSSGDVKRIVEKLDLFVVPLVNPDGRAFDLNLNALTKPDGSFDNTPTGGGRFDWRMNRRPNPSGDPNNPFCVGVDLNRNFDIAWHIEEYYNTTSGVDAAIAPCGSDNYRGPSAASEPETRNVVSLVEDQSIQFSLDIHSAAGAMFFPWGIEDTQSDDQFKSFDNPLWNFDPAHPDEHPGRDGVGHPAYAEFFPDSGPIRLRTQHFLITNTMRDAVVAAAGSNADASANSTYRSGHLASVLNEAGSASESYPASMMDWVFSRQFLGGRTDPVFSFGIEVIPPPAPSISNLMRPDPTLAYPKAEREVFIAVHTWLKYIAAWWPPTTGSSTCPCFIATAAFGSADHPRVEFLRDLRDRVFPATAAGKKFIHSLLRIYYSFSPAVARYLNGHEAARWVVRTCFLLPLVAILRGFMKFGRRTEQHSVILMGTIFGLVLAVFAGAVWLAFVVEMFTH